ncbi:hypothetical protein BDW59DRAFT_136986 [Aspergillus cavernicola]|uniref:Secreted protein n=1 Tax=Aspergillus cavernicola TaxID=176166 RepID=A0ABR4J5E2_9EURO
MPLMLFGRPSSSKLDSMWPSLFCLSGAVVAPVHVVGSFYCLRRSQPGSTRRRVREFSRGVVLLCSKIEVT